jgi:hypothetical protein
VSFAIENLVALVDRGLTNGLRQMTLACPARPEKQNVLALVDERCGGQIENQAAIDFGIERKVEVVEALVGIAETCLFVTAFQ